MRAWVGRPMDFDEIEALRRHSVAWRLLRADHAPLVLGFLGRVFVADNVRSIPAHELISRLDDELFALNERLGEGTYPRAAKAYLDDWAAPEVGWLRKYYPQGSDEAHFDATPAFEKALSWVASLRERSFVGTESRLNTIVELLRQMVFGAETDPEARLTELHRRRTQIDEEIKQVESGNFALMEPSAQRDRYQQFASMARELLGDFREVEANFRKLDRQMRERVAGWDGSKGELLDEVLRDRHGIAESDQGKSFQSFYDFLLTPDRQDELAELLTRVQELEAVGDADERLRFVHHDWLEAAEATQATVRQLSDQLRRFLDDQVWLENRRVMEVLRGIESKALRLRELASPDFECAVDATSPDIVLPMERPLYTPSVKYELDSTSVSIADAYVDSSALFEQVFVDRERLSATIRQALAQRSQIGLSAILESQPLQQGLAELVAYLALEDPEFDVIFDEQRHEQVQWEDDGGTVRIAEVPRVTFVRKMGG